MGIRPDGRMFFTRSSLLWPVAAQGDRYMLKIAGPSGDGAHAAAGMVAAATHMGRQAEITAGRAALGKKQLLQCVFLHALQAAARAEDEGAKAHFHACAGTAPALAQA
ncbi:MAG: hypothetical protein KGL10_04300 [Alphaproteobacteria bacterium]|nr:hypothetical protein [Alphaproteobacteria bacterium]